MLDVQGVDDFEKYHELVKEKAKQGVCVIVRHSFNETMVTDANINFISLNGRNFLDSNSFSLAVNSFFDSLTSALMFNSGGRTLRLWQSQKVEYNGDYFISVVSLQADEDSESRLLKGVDKIRFSLKVNVMEYSVPFELVPK
jgi:hypothetical protein